MSWNYKTAILYRKSRKINLTKIKKHLPYVTMKLRESQSKQYSFYGPLLGGSYVAYMKYVTASTPHEIIAGGVFMFLSMVIGFYIAIR